MQEILAYLSDLRANNNREWFNDNKRRYIDVKGKVEALTERLIAGVCNFEPEAGRLRPADCLYRIYRDTRFSPDKTPYKTHIGIYINPPGGKKAPTAGYYLHLEPESCMVAGGAWCPDSRQLKAIRQDIYDNSEEYIEILNSPEFSKYYKIIGEDCLKTAPKGFPKDWEHIELLRPRSFTTYTALTDRDVMSADFESKVLTRMRVLAPFNRFLNYTLTEK